MLKFKNQYWLFQITGWSILVIFNLFIAYSLKKVNSEYLQSLLFTILIAASMSHVMRNYIKKNGIVRKPINHQLISMVLISIVTALITALVTELIDSYLIKYVDSSARNTSFTLRLFFGALNMFWIFLIWCAIYFGYHLFKRNQEQQLNTLRLETLVKNLELQTIKNHINPHFIFNALNSIRALVDENPQIARKAITQLSNILRSSLQARHKETVPLSEELAIVKDYLALEQIRFEERLKVEFNIEEETLHKQVPPMMLQTLVENAIKHGIAHSLDGGTIYISSYIQDNLHRLLVKNTGTFQKQPASQTQGFGIKSSKDRLYLLYQDKANFEIYNAEDGTVESRISLPLNTIKYENQSSYN